MENTGFPVISVLDQEIGISDTLSDRDHVASRQIDGSLKTSKWLTTSEAAIYLRLSIGSFRNMLSEGGLPFYKLGRRNRYRRSELEKVLLAQPKGPRSNGL